MYLRKVWYLPEVGVLAPHGLRHHLAQFHGGDGGRQPAARAEHVDAGLDEADGLAHDELRVLLQLGRQLDPGEVRLQEDVGLGVRVVELGAADLVRQLRRQVPILHTGSKC